MGWSMPKNNPQTGPKPKCKGCERAIEKNEKRICHRCPSDMDPGNGTVNMFHLKTSCLMSLNSDDMKSFLEKKWTAKKVQIVQNTIAKFAEETDDSD